MSDSHGAEEVEEVSKLADARICPYRVDFETQKSYKNLTFKWAQRVKFICVAFMKGIYLRGHFPGCW